MAWVLDTTIPDIYTDNTVQGNVHTCLEPPYPKPMWYVTENPYDVKTAATKDYHTPCFDMPFPAPMWYVTEDPDDVKTSVTKDVHICFDHPFPSMVWYITTEPLDIKNDPVVICESMGAFRDCANLSYVYIPPTVKEIGSEAFGLTRLTEVTVASDCDYKEDSFPPNCAIYTYET